MNAISRQRVLQPGEPILSAGDTISWFGNIVSGAVKLTKLLSDGRQQIVGLQFPPDFLGRAFKERSPYYVEAATEVELCIFPKPAFEKILKEKPDVELRLFRTRWTNWMPRATGCCCWGARRRRRRSRVSCT